MVIFILEQCLKKQTYYSRSQLSLTSPPFSNNFILHLVSLFTLCLPNIFNCTPSLHNCYIKQCSPPSPLAAQSCGEMCDIFHLQFPPGNEGPQGRDQPLHHILLLSKSQHILVDRYGNLPWENTLK